MSLDARTFIQRFESYCPQYLAEKGDPVGLHIGTLEKKIERVMVTLDVRPEVVAEAIEKKVDLIIAKHPPIFRPIQRLTIDQPQTKMYSELLKHEIAVYAAHTNLDIIDNGLNDWFCEQLGIQQTSYLKETHKIPYKKLAVFVPVAYASMMRQCLADAGAGKQGNYKNTSYSAIGQGRFTPQKNAHPTIGTNNQETLIEEEKIEVIFPETEQEKIIQAMYSVHPYEEPAYDIYLLENYYDTYGIGRIGNLARAISVKDLVEEIKNVFQLDGVRIVTTNEQKKVQRIAICGGSGEKFFRDALRKQADVYITGDVYYHTGHDMLTEGLTVIDPGHYIEQLCKTKLVEMFNHWKKQDNWDVTFMVSEIDTNPFAFR